MTDEPREPTFRERLGGRWAISWQAWAITAPLAVVTLLVGSVTSTDELLGWLVVGILSVGIVGAWVYLTHRTVFRNRAVRPIAVPVSIAFAIIAAALFIAAATGIAVVLGLPPENGPISRSFPTMVIATWWTVAITLALEAASRFGRERDALIERAIQQQLAAMQEADVADRLRASIREEVTDRLSEARAQVERHLDAIMDATPSEFSAAAADLRGTAQGAVRPLSHHLADQAGRAYPKPGFLAVLGNIIRRQPFRPFAVSLIYVVTTAPREIERTGWGLGTFWVCFTVSLIVIIMSVANLAMRRWPERHAAFFLAGIALIELPSFALADFYSRMTGIELSWGQVLVSACIGVLLILVTSGFGSWRATRRQLLRTFASDVREEEIATIARSQAVAAAAREAAAVLHGSVQTKLNACAMAIDHAAERGDLVAINQALVQARAILDQPVPDLAGASAETLADEVERKAALWRGLVQVVTSVDPGIGSLTGRTASQVGAVVEEGIANAVQHGSASVLEVDVRPKDGRLVVRITDNGSGPTQGVPGLGSRLLDEIAPGWHLDRHADGARLTAALPLPQTSSSQESTSVWV